jgi:hypothetical protein
MTEGIRVLMELFQNKLILVFGKIWLIFGLLLIILLLALLVMDRVLILEYVMD